MSFDPASSEASWLPEYGENFDNMGHSLSDKDGRMSWALSPDTEDAPDTPVSQQSGDALRDFDIRAVPLGHKQVPASPPYTPHVRAGEAPGPSVEQGVPSGTAAQDTVDSNIYSFISSTSADPASVSTTDRRVPATRSFGSRTSEKIREVGIDTSHWLQSLPNSFNPLLDAFQSVACTQPSPKSLPQCSPSGELPVDLAAIANNSLLQLSSDEMPMIAVVLRSENLTATDIVLSSKNPDTSFSLPGADKMGQRVSIDYYPDVGPMPPLPQYMNQANHVEASPFYRTEDLLMGQSPGGATGSVVVKEEVHEHDPHVPVAMETKRRRKRKGGIPDVELEEEIHKKKAKDAAQLQSTEPGEEEKKERRKKQNREAAERCRLKKNQETGELRKDKQRLEKVNPELEMEIARLNQEKAELEAILANCRCSEVPSHTLALWRRETHRSHPLPSTVVNAMPDQT